MSAMAVQAYRDLARITHPDKVSGDGPEKEAAQKKFMDIAEAYEVRSCLPLVVSSTLRHDML